MAKEDNKARKPRTKMDLRPDKPVHNFKIMSSPARKQIERGYDKLMALARGTVTQDGVRYPIEGNAQQIDFIKHLLQEKHAMVFAALEVAKASTCSKQQPIVTDIQDVDDDFSRRVYRVNLRKRNNLQHPYRM